jgi:hypothetical protein
MVDADLGTTQAAEIFLSLIGASAVQFNLTVGMYW